MISVSFVAANDTAAAIACFAKVKNDAPAWLGLASAEAALLNKAAQSKRFTGAAGKALEITPATSDAARMIVMGSDADLTPAKAEVLGAKAYQALELSAGTEILIDAAALGDAAVSAAAAAGALQFAYRFDTYRTELKPEQKPSITTIKVTAANPAAAEAAFAEHKAIVEGVYLTRDLVSEPANILYPETFADRAAQLADLGVEITVMDKAELTEKGFDALLGVAQGSVRDPRVVIMHWKGAEGEPVAFVGKGVTFDTGGISLKPPAGMEDMKWDMGGAGVVTGLMHTLAARKAKVNAIGIIGLVENMPDGNAQRPGDIVTSLSGKTIQVLNTDAEGRLVLADIMWYVQEVYKPKAMIDLATLTGAILVGLGMEKAGLFSNNDDLAKELISASANSGDPLWHMPIGPEYNKQLDCAEADMKNIGGGRWGGSITAACFLERFVQGDRPWAHLDIAGVTWSDKGKPLSRKGATGWGVRLLNQWVKETQEG